MPKGNLKSRTAFLLGAVLLCLIGCGTLRPEMRTQLDECRVEYDTPTDPALQKSVIAIDARLRARHEINTEQTAVGLLDLNTCRLAMIHPDRVEYAASVPKIGILLAYFQLHAEAATNLSPQARHELGLMIKVSDNEIAAKYSHELGLKQIQEVLNSYELYDRNHGGGIWVGKHYGQGGERYGDPIGDHSHAATVRQLLRYYLLLEQGRLVSRQASRTMREIFASPDIPPLNDRFVKALAGRGLEILRKSGWWEDWFHDTAIVRGDGRHYILVALTHHPAGDAYLEEFAREADDLMKHPLR